MIDAFKRKISAESAGSACGRSTPAKKSGIWGFGWVWDVNLKKRFIRFIPNYLIPVVPLLALKIQKDLSEIAGWVGPTKKDMGLVGHLTWNAKHSFRSCTHGAVH
jgi:hypothetical protein